MFNILQKYGLSIAVSVAALISIIGILSYNSTSITYVEARESVSRDVELSKIKDPQEQNEAMRAKAQALYKESNVDGVGILLGLGNFLLILAATLSLGVPAYFLKDEPKKLIKAVGVVAAALLLFFIIYSMSSSEVLNVKEGFSIKEAKTTGAIVTLIVVGVVAAILSIIGSEINNFIKER